MTQGRLRAEVDNILILANPTAKTYLKSVKSE